MKVMKKSLVILLATMGVMLLASCQREKRRIVAVSQCSMDEWRDQMNAEMRREAFFHTELDVEYHSTADNSEEQIRDIESFIQRHVDLIVVAPNEEEALTPVIERAYDAGIPVVLIDRRVNTDKYTAYVGGDNVEVGRQAAQYIIGKLPQGGRIMEIEGLASSSASQERRDGFHQILDHHPEIEIVRDEVADWQRLKAHQKLASVTAQEWADVDVVFAYNDRMAIGAWEAYALNHKPDTLTINHKPSFIGVDALMNDSIGVGRIEDKTLEASFLYPTGGDKAIHTAACILAGQPYPREQILQTSIVNKSNVHLMRLQADHIDEQNVKIEFQNQRLDDFFRQYSAQRTLLLATIVFVIIVCILLAVSIRAYHAKHRLNTALARQRDQLQRQHDELAEQKELVERQRDQLEEERDRLMEHIAPSDTAQSPSQSPSLEGGVRGESTFLTRLQQVIDRNLSNSELTVDMIGAEVNLGRVQLYRKCKAACGMSPNELLRSSRLNKAYQLLRDTDSTVSEVAYAVGFTSPSYFAKCYKDLFGRNPSSNQ